MIKLALLDMNNNVANQGMHYITEIAKDFRDESEHPIEIKHFDVRYKKEVPAVADFDIFISSGGPGDPHLNGNGWEEKYAQLLDEIWTNNLKTDNKKFLFLICHSFQIAVEHWKLGKICKRKSYSFGVLPVHKTRSGKKEFIFENLPDPFYAVDSRAHQFIEPDRERMTKLGMQVVAIEKHRPYIPLERAIMALRFSDEIFGTQFHPEADAPGFLEHLDGKESRKKTIESYGVKKYKQTVKRLKVPTPIEQTKDQILPRFLRFATAQIAKEKLSMNKTL